ncbi:Calx-beta domain-containing protein [Peristeroidobacter soli]|uniref:Calx-beta domain-containing protein n=1 Tax=Peristeroidobacter soli TaxID=2497877 RepID=UPI00101D7BBD|nr:Calx-beta domain-containing protein [Peristeroidobacter soli]
MGSSGTSAGVIGIRTEIQYPPDQTLRVTEDDTSMPLRVYRSGGTDGTVSVQYRVVGLTATAGQDFVADPGTVTFNPGEASRVIYVPILEDSLVESAEDLYVELFAPTAGATLSRSRADFGITDDDRVSSPAQPGVGISSDVTVNEGAGTATLTVTLAEPPNQNFNVSYWLRDGTATSHDFSGGSTTMTLTWVAGDSAPKQIVIPIVDDSLDEIDETFMVYVSNDQGSEKRASASARVTIVDNDPTPAGQSGPTAQGIQFSATSLTVHEGGYSVPLTLSRVGGNHGKLDVNCAYVAGSATEPDDYLRLEIGTSWEDGADAARNFEIHLNGDTQVEANETFTLRCSPRMGLVDLTPVDVTVTIVDDDVASGTPARVEFVSATQSVNENVTSVTLQVARSGNTSIASSVEYTTLAGTAASGDFTAASGTLTWAANDVSTKLITVALTPDAVDESDESFTVSLRNASAGTELGVATATVTIVDDDGAASTPSNSGGGGGGQESWLALLLWATLVAIRRRA